MRSVSVASGVHAFDMSNKYYLLTYLLTDDTDDNIVL